MADMLDRLARLSPERRALLQKLMQAGAEAERDPDEIRRRSPGTPPPLSFAQQRLWFVDQLAPGTATYNVPFPLRLRGGLDAGTLRRALSKVVRRHEALRTVFAGEGGEPVQVVLPPAPVPFPVVELSGLPAAAREAETRRLAGEEARRPFDLAAGPLLRATLLRLDGADHAVLFTLHHVVSDGWSTGVLARELSALYAAFLRGERSPLPELPVQYADYAVWQRAWLAGERLDAQLAYWRERLAGAPPVLELPVDRPARATLGSPAGGVRATLGPAVARGATELARREGATPFMVLLAAWQLLLGRYADQDDVVVGTPVAGRTRVELEGLIGFFVNTLALRTDLSGDPSFRELLGRVRAAAMGAYEHQDLPFERLVEELAVERSLVHTPVFQVMFALQNTEAGELRLGEARMEPLVGTGGTSQFALGLVLREDGDRVEGALSFRADLFDESTAARMLGHFGVLLEGALEGPGRRVSEIPLLGPEERDRLLGEWSAGPAAPPPTLTLHELFAEQAARTPHAVAVVHGDAALTYAGLQERAGELAVRLRARGVGPEVRVGVCMERSAGAVVALLGVLRTGGVYVPLDPAYPADRLAFMLEDSGVRAVVSDERHAGRLPAFAGEVLRVESDGMEAGAASHSRTPALSHPPLPDSLAYVVYTSGSTGRPKGVMVTHEAAAGLLAAAVEAFGTGPGSRVAQTVTPSFDASLLETLVALLSGAALHVADRDTVLSAGALEAFLREREIDTWVSTPALLESLPDADFPALRSVSTGGERCPGELAARWSRDRRLMNMYGPTETTIYATWHPCVPGSAEAPPIGRPVAGARGYVLDAGGEPVPVGMPGELYVGGAGVARGYLGQPALTAGRFVPDALSGRRGARLYRTGDRVRWRPDGELEFLGRSDEQVKIRGVRIEPGEIEAVLLAHPAVRAAAVTVREDAPGRRLLVAYAAAGGGVTAAELRERARGALPEHMVPAAVVLLEALPTTPAGKLDRRALPAPGGTSGEAEHTPPRTPTEVALAEIFAGVLGAERVGTHDGFFELGGHSLLATRVVSQVRKKLGVEVPLRAVFEAPTVAALAAWLEANRPAPEPEEWEVAEEWERLAGHSGGRPADGHRGGATARAAGHPGESRTLKLTSEQLDRLSPERRMLLQKMLAERSSARRAGGEPAEIPRRGGDGPAPLSFAQQRLWFIHRLDPRSPAYNMPRALRLRGALDPVALRRSLAELVRRHEVTRTSLVERGGEAVQVVLPPAPFRLPVVDLSGLAGERREAEGLRRIMDEGDRPFDLGRGPLLRALLVRLGPADWMIQFNMHHVVSDGWSMGVLTAEVSALYGAFSRGDPSPLPELPIQYADFAAWQRERLSGEALEAQLAYWRRRLAGAPPVLELPTDHPRRAFVGASEERVPFVLPAAATAAVRALARSGDATLFMTLLAAWQALLGRYAAQDDVVVGTPIANRTRAELEGLIGFFVNTLVLRADLSGDPTFLELLGRVRETTLDAYAHQDLPFERLVEELAPERSLLHNPLVQVMFALQNTEPGTLALGGVAVEPLGGGKSGAKFDVGVSLFEVGEQLVGDLTFRGDLFEPATIDRMAGHFRLLLEGATADPARPLSALRLVGPAEERRILEAWNPRREVPEAALVPQLLAEQAARTPHAPAASGGGLVLSHGELDRRSDRLAALLRSLGVGPETLVAVCLERGPALLVAVLGTWKASGAYLPLDPDYPADRLEYMLRDSGARVLVTAAHLAGALPEHGAETVLMDTDGNPEFEVRSTLENVEAEDGAVAGCSLFPVPCSLSLAYVIYTSGSTGRPKGVRVSHRSLLHTLHAAREEFGFGADDRVPGLASFAFDIWLFEAVLPLLAGGSVHLVPRERVLHTERLVDELAACTALHAVPALMRQTALVLRASGRTLPGIRRAFVGGDAVPPDLLDEMREVFPAASLHVLYGPTEAAIICASHRAGPGGARRQWVGRPLGNAALRVLDAALRPVPVGVPGELCIGGASVARDYLDRPDATAEKWVPDPFAGEAGARLYRTGDRVRWTADGELEFLGRTDAQVKVRGFRIEPGEVEAVLAEHPGVEEAVVAVREDTPGDRRLVGYVVPAAEDGPGDGARPAALQEEHVREWESLFGDAYGGGDAAEDPAFHVAGWNSSYTGEPIPEPEMREWVEHAAGRVRALRPRRVLEIGCGTGLLLFRVAPECEEYWAADFSAEAIEYLRRQLAHPGRELPQVRLLERTAEDFAGIPAGHFDVVVVNSVAQYFPGVDYLLRVVDGAVGALAPGGTLWVGDVRSLPLLEAFHASVEAAQAAPETPASALRDRVRRRTAREKELLLDPELFRALPRRLPRVSGVEIRLKEGRHANEMTRFRYDVAVRVEGPPPPAAPAWRRWDPEGGLAALARELDERAPAALALARVPDARVAGALAVLEALAGHGEPRGAAELRSLAAEREAAAVDPEALRVLGEARGYRVHARPSAGGAAGEMDVLLARGDAAALVEEVPAAPPAWAAWASDPLAAKRTGRLLPGLRAWLGERLPDYMVPGALVLLDALPLLPNGKIDRRALPAPETAAEGDRTAPRTPTEAALAEIWAEVLRVETVGADDDFFALGGHSLLATRVVSRVREALGVELPLRALFESPTVARLAERADALLREGAGVQLPPLRPAPREGPLPLSFAQQRLWFIHQLEPHSPAYNMPSPLRLRGPLRPRALQAALGELVRRHESLRTVFRSAAGEPVQVILPPAPAVLPVVDLGGLPEGRREPEARRIAAAEAALPFDLERGPLLRAALLRPGEEEWALLFTVHHVVSDGWSMGVLVREISLLYDAFARGLPSPLPEPRLQYADYAVWQRGWLAGEALERQLAYWRERLAGAPPLLEIPADHPRPAVAGDRGGQRAFMLSVETSRALRALAHREGATLFMTLLAVYQALLARWSGQDDVSVGTPVAGRRLLELEGLIGFFVNMLVIRTGLAGRPGGRELVGRVREGVLGAQAHQDLPFERLVDELSVERSLDRAPLFQALFALLGAGPGEERLSLGGVEVYPLHGGEATAKFDLSLTLQDGGEALAGSMVFRADLFEPATIERMLGHFRALADGVAADPDRPVGEIDLLSPAERAQVLEAWNDTARPYPAGLRVHDLFAAQAARTPGAVAVAWRGERLTYAELDRRSARLAGALRRRGVGPETRVGVCLARTPELPVALLAVLRAGGAYVPLDPAYPPERLGFMVEDAGISLVLTESALADRVPAGAAELLVLDGELEAPSAGAEPAPESGVLPENLSHVIFTSGSTGRPKGVMIRHSSTVVLLHWLREAVSDEERSAVLFSTSVSFDVSVAELFGTLSWGGRLVLVENALELASLEEPVVCASMVPSAAAELLRTGGIPPCVKTLNLGGEALPAALARGLYALGTVDRVRNLYGPTEDTTYSTCSLVPRGAEQVSVGRPVAGTRAYVLDAALLPVPAGVIGELYLAGEGLARGYAGRADLTAERFLPCPFGAPGDRMYRVMDRVRWRADGELEYFGRTDFQVKVRGFRIEPGEIEAALGSHPAVREAVAVVREDAPGDRRLVAYVAADPGAVSPAELRALAAARLPEYMVPSAVVVLEAFPLLPNGKTDRRALPAPERTGREGEGTAPRDALELTVARAWAEVLGLPEVGVHDGFFELGGHSLLGVRLMARIEELTGRRLPLATLFAAPTVEALAAALRDGAAAGAGPLVPIQPHGAGRPLFFVHAAGGNVVGYAALARHLGGAQPFYGLQSRGLEGDEAPRAGIEAMAADYLAEIRAAQPAGPYRLGGWSMGGVVAWEMARQLEAAGEAVELLALVDPPAPGDGAADSTADADDAGLLASFALHLGIRPERIPVSPAELLALAPAERLRFAWEAARAEGQVPPDLDFARFERLWSVFRHNVEALRRYRPGPLAASGDVLVVRAEEGEVPAETGAGAWRALAGGRAAVAAVPGDHFGIVREPHVHALAEVLAARLERG